MPPAPPPPPPPLRTPADPADTPTPPGRPRWTPVLVGAVLGASLTAGIWLAARRPDVPVPARDTSSRDTSTNPVDHRAAFCRAQLRVLAQAVDLYKVLHRALPPTLAALLERNPTTDEPYLSKLPTDPWDSAYAYREVDARRRAYEIRSAGPDRQLGTDDDLVVPDSTPPR